MKLLIGIVAVIACFYLAESLDCNKCSFSVFGYCISSGTQTCTSSNTSVCYSLKFTFDDLPSWTGMSRQGCSDSSTCSITGNGTTSVTVKNDNITLLNINIPYTSQTQCCSTDKCNTVNLSGGASVNSMSLSVVLSAAALAVVGWSHM